MLKFKAAIKTEILSVGAMMDATAPAAPAITNANAPSVQRCQAGMMVGAGLLAGAVSAGGVWWLLVLMVMVSAGPSSGCCLVNVAPAAGD